MKKIIITSLSSILWTISIFGQFTAVTYDVNKAWFNEGQALPAEKDMVFRGILPGNTEGISISILSSTGHKLLYQATCMKENNNEFSIPVSYKLRADANYDFKVDFFETLSSEKQKELKKDMKATMSTYIDVNLSGEKSIKLLKKPGKIVDEMDEIIKERMSHLHNKIADWKPQFSEVVKLKLEQLDNANLELGYSSSDSTKTKELVREVTRQRLVEELKAQVDREIDQIFSNNFLALSETQIINDYPTEVKESGFSLNVGYAGVYLSGKFDDLTYGSSPFIGLAFPLGNSALGSSFFANSAVTLGVMLNPFENEAGETINGFLVKTPIYLGLDHRLFKFIRVNAGATFLEDPKSNSGNKILVRPFLGLSAKIDLTIGLGK